MIRREYEWPEGIHKLESDLVERVDDLLRVLFQGILALLELLFRLVEATCLLRLNFSLFLVSLVLLLSVDRRRAALELR